MTLEQTYEYAKAQFIELSRAIHLGYNTYDPLFTIAADAVRSVTKCEPIAEGARRNAESNTAAQLVVGYMITKTSITKAQLARMMGKKSHTTICHNLKQHYAKCDTDYDYRKMCKQVGRIIKENYYDPRG